MAISAEVKSKAGKKGRKYLWVAVLDRMTRKYVTRRWHLNKDKRKVRKQGMRIPGK